MYSSFLLKLVIGLYFASRTLQDHDVFYPLVNAKDQLATKINCRTNETRQFKYNSVIDLWNDVKGQILLDVDFVLHCLGSDNGEPYGNDAIKYVAEITNLVIDEKHEKFDEPLRRRKRGVWEFFSNAWDTVKNFFLNLFGYGPSSSEKSKPVDIEERNYDDFSSTTTIFTTTTTTATSPPVTEENDDDEEYDSSKYKPSYSVPFEFIQLANGTIPEVRFAASDTDGRVRNFKRHLVDAFATQLSTNHMMDKVVETSVMGEHRSKYNITSGPMTSAFSAPGNDDEIEMLNDEGGTSTIIIEKDVTENDILTLAPSSGNDAINDKDNMDLNAHQQQIFKDGILVSTRGSSHLVLFPNGKQKRNRRRRAPENDNSEENVVKYFQVHSTFNLQLVRRHKRSLDDNRLDPRILGQSFTTASRAAESEDTSVKERAEEMQMSVENSARLLHETIDSESNGESLQTLFELVDQEVRNSLDEEPEALSQEIRAVLTEQVLSDVCLKKFKKCVDLMQLLSRAGGSQAEQVLLSFIGKDSLSVRQRQEISDLLSEIPKPSSKILLDINNLLQKKDLDKTLLGSVALSASNMASKTDEDQKKILAKTLAELLDRSWSPTDTETNPLIIDLLEAIGNMGDEINLDQILRISSSSSAKTDIQIACAHALRHMASIPRVQEWMLGMITGGSCDIIHAIVGSLLDEISKQEMSGDRQNWPRNGIRDVDIILRNKLRNAAPEFSCAAADVARYLRRKRSQEESEPFFEDDSEPFEPGTQSRQKREVWDNLDCGEWMDDKKYVPIQEKDEFESDRETYNKRKSCLATKSLGLAGAKTEIYAGMFAGVRVPSIPPKYKLFTKFVSGVDFLGHEIEIGSFYFYHHSGYTKAYVRIMGKTRQEFRHNGCTPSDMRYRPIIHIPLFLVRIAVVQFSLGIHLSSQLSLDMQCPEEDIYDMIPQSKIRVGGEAMGTVLFARGAINLGGNFNYHLKFLFTPVPDMCLSGQHGYDPMSISMEAYYQLWSLGKLRWGKPRTWQPSSLKWDMGRSNTHQWFNNTCILKDEPVKSRAATTTTTTAAAPSTEDEENYI